MGRDDPGEQPGAGESSRITAWCFATPRATTSGSPTTAISDRAQYAAPAGPASQAHHNLQSRHPPMRTPDRTRRTWAGRANLSPLDGSGSHDRPGGNDSTLTYEWRIATGAYGTKLSGVIHKGPEPVVTFQPDVPGEWTISLTVTNDMGETAADRMGLRLLSIGAGAPADLSHGRQNRPPEGPGLRLRTPDGCNSKIGRSAPTAIPANRWPGKRSFPLSMTIRPRAATPFPRH